MKITAVSLRAASAQNRRPFARVPESQINALPGQRVHIMRGVPHQGKARSDKVCHPLQLERKGRSGSHWRQRTERLLTCRLYLGGEFVGIESKQFAAVRLVRRP